MANTGISLMIDIFLYDANKFMDDHWLKLFMMMCGVSYFTSVET